MTDGQAGMTYKQATWLLRWVVVIMIGIVILVICCITRVAPPDPGYAWVSACGADSVKVIVRAPGATDVSTYSQFPISGPVTDIPEFNDCQRFIKNGRYVTSYAIFVAYYVRSAWVKLRGKTPRDTIDTILPTAIISGSRIAIPVATVYSWGGTYSELGIEPGFNCLFLYVDPKEQTRIVPRMVPWGKTDPDCGALADGFEERFNNGKDLELKQPTLAAARADTLTSADFPAVARWDFDPVNGEHYIGLMCERGWCEIGDTGFQSSPTVNKSAAFIAANDPLTNRVFAVKGWNDVQRLASSTQSGTPSSVVGELIPHPQLDGLNKTANAYTKWDTVAVARVSSGYKFFKEGENTIALCRGSGESCKVPSSERSCSPQPAADDNWWTMIKPPAGELEYRCVKRMDHTEAIREFNATHITKISIPGTVRWRWQEEDEKIWISCEVGCCTVIQ